MVVRAAVNPDRLVRAFLDLVAVDSPTGHEERIGQELERRFSLLGCRVRRDDIGNLIAVLPGRRDGTILVSTHMDTAGTDRSIRPVIGGDRVIRSDGLTILGADDKAAIASCLEFLTLLPEHPELSHPTVEFVVTTGAESGLVGAHGLDVAELHATHGFVLDTSGEMGSITYWSPTLVHLTITFHGRRAHAGVEPERGINAVVAAAQAIAAMPLGRIDQDTVANIGTIAGGESPDAVPGTVVLQAMVRGHDRARLDSQLGAMRKACLRAARARGAMVEVVEECAYRSYRIGEEAAPYREAAAAIRGAGLEVVARKSSGGTDGNVFNARGIPCVVMPTGVVDEHAPSEHIAIDDLVVACRVLVAVATRPALMVVGR